MVRETGDHGPFNSWDRQPYLTVNGVVDGFPTSDKLGNPAASIIKRPDTIERNLLINGYNSVWTIDHDDGSQFFNDTHNLMVFGGCKNYLGNSKSCDDNVIVYPGTSSRSAGNYRCVCFAGTGFADQYFQNNTCLTADGVVYTYGFQGAVRNCSDAAIAPHVYATRGNTFHAPPGVNLSTGGLFGGHHAGACSGFAAWQAAGQDAASRAIASLPTAEQVVAMGREVLAFPPA